MSLTSSLGRRRGGQRYSSANTLTASTQLWAARAGIAGRLMPDSVQIANELDRALIIAGLDARLKGLWPLLGEVIDTAAIPLIDPLGVGAATITGFTSADFSQRTGLQGNGSTKQLNLLITPSQLSGGIAGGMGYRELQASATATSTELMGCLSSGGGGAIRWCIDTRSDREIMIWGSTASSLNGGIVTPGNEHLYIQCANSSDRKLYRDTVQVGSSTASDSTTVEATRTIRLMGSIDSGGVVTYHAGRCGFAYVTDGALTSQNRIDLDFILTEKLLKPTRRI